MKTNIRYSIIGILFWMVALSISLIGFIVLLSNVDAGETPLWGVIVYGVFSLISIIMLLNAINNLQWFDIADGYITIRSPFGIIKHVQLTQIKKAFKTNAVIYSIKMLHIRRPHIALCLKKSIAKADAGDAYNGKKKPYIILPYSVETEILICSEYKDICGEALIIE